jgi:hypothetical protein
LSIIDSMYGGQIRNKTGEDVDTGGEIGKDLNLWFSQSRQQESLVCESEKGDCGLALRFCLPHVSGAGERPGS